MLWDALGTLWDALGRSGDALGRSGDAVGRSGNALRFAGDALDTLGHSGMLWECSGMIMVVVMMMIVFHFYTYKLPINRFSDRYVMFFPERPGGQGSPCPALKRLRDRLGF